MRPVNVLSRDLLTWPFAGNLSRPDPSIVSGFSADSVFSGLLPGFPIKQMEQVLFWGKWRTTWGERRCWVWNLRQHSQPQDSGSKGRFLCFGGLTSAHPRPRILKKNEPRPAGQDSHPGGTARCHVPSPLFCPVPLAVLTTPGKHELH